MNTQLALITKYRTQLMGVAIIAVMVVHLLQCFPDESIRGFAAIVYEIPNMIFTNGFLFLSGFGLYFSYIHRTSLKEFYLKRIKRLFIPYVLVSAPLLLLPTFSQYGMNIWAYVGRLTTISYWVEGNFCAMWYVAVSMMLYICYPLIYALFVDKGIRTLIFCLFYWAVCALCRVYNPDLYWTHMFLPQIPCFIFGVYCASISKKKDFSFGVVFSVLFVLYVILDFLSKRGWYFGEFAIPSLHRLSYIVVFSMLFKWMSAIKLDVFILPFQWFGRYTLELYMLHMLLFSNLILIFHAASPAFLMCISIIMSILLCLPLHIGIERIVKHFF